MENVDDRMVLLAGGHRGSSLKACLRFSFCCPTRY
jgi:hypothetical protein